MTHPLSLACNDGNGLALLPVPVPVKRHGLIAGVTDDLFAGRRR